MSSSLPRFRQSNPPFAPCPNVSSRIAKNNHPTWRGMCYQQPQAAFIRQPLNLLKPLKEIPKASGSMIKTTGIIYQRLLVLLQLDLGLGQLGQRFRLAFQGRFDKSGGFFRKIERQCRRMSLARHFAQRLANHIDQLVIVEM